MMADSGTGELGKFLMAGGAICILVWVLFHMLWMVGLALIIAGLVLYLADLR